MTAAEIRTKGVAVKNKILWKNVLLSLKESLTHTEFITWFPKTIIQSFEEDRINIATATQAGARRLDTKYYDIIQNAVNGLLGKGYKVKFSVDTDLLYKDDRLVRLSDVSRSFNAVGIAQQVQGVQEAPGIFSKKTDRDFSLSNVVEGAHNQVALACVKAVYHGRSTFNPLFIYAGVGLGKTHLLQGLYNDLKKSNPSARVVYSTSETFTDEIVRAMGKGTKAVEEFRRKYRSTDILLIDDIQFIAGKEKTQEEFFHLFNILVDNKKQVILTSDRHPSEMQRFDQRLLSRFSSGIITDIVFPDYDVRLDIIRQKTAQMGLFIDLPTVEYIATNCQSSVRQMEGALSSLGLHLSLLKHEGTFQFTKPILDKILYLEFPTTKTVSRSAEDIIGYICEYYKLDVAIVKSKSRDRQLTLARSVCMYILKDRLKLTFEEIGKLFNRNFATVIHSFGKIKQELAFNRGSVLSGQVEYIMRQM